MDMSLPLKPVVCAYLRWATARGSDPRMSNRELSNDFLFGDPLLNAFDFPDFGGPEHRFLELYVIPNLFEILRPLDRHASCINRHDNEHAWMNVCRDGGVNKSVPQGGTGE